MASSTNSHQFGAGIQTEAINKLGDLLSDTDNSPVFTVFLKKMNQKRSPSDTILCLELLLAPIAQEDRASVS